MNYSYLIPKRYLTLQDLVDEMESSSVNAVPVTLLDMYPESINDNYQRGQDFLEHSQYFDVLNSMFYQEHGSIYGKFCHKIGGMRKRVMGTDVCIHKFPFNKYDFDPIGMAPGYHFFQDDEKILRQCAKIRLHDIPGLLLHIKFIKPNLAEFFQIRIKNNQDWNNSSEYRSYSRLLKEQEGLSLYDFEYSRKLVSIEDLEQYF